MFTNGGKWGALDGVSVRSSVRQGTSFLWLQAGKFLRGLRSLAHSAARREVFSCGAVSLPTGDREQSINLPLEVTVKGFNIFLRIWLARKNVFSNASV